MTTESPTVPARAVPPPSPPDDAVLERAMRLALRTATGVLRDREAAADVAQEVALTTLRRHGTLRDPAALDAWVHRTAVRAALREARRRETRRAAESAVARPDEAPPADDLQAALALLAPLPPRQRAALILRYVHDLDDRAIARALGCRRGTARSLLSRGLAELRRLSDAHPEGVLR